MGGETKIIYTSIPKISDLVYYIGLIDPNEEKDKSAPSEFQWQILKSRFLIWKNQDVLAAPIQKRFSQIHVIMSKDQAHTLPEKLKAQRLIPDGPYRLDEYVYQECITYTLTFKMAPQWNRIHNFFLYSNEFLTSADPMEGVKFDISISGNDGRLTMSLTMHRVKLPLLNLDSMGVNMESLKTSGFARISSTVYILPQLKKGTAVNISVKIPDGCPFTSYFQLRKHWKNTHGYHLPHDEEGMLYVGVNFGWNNTPYSYPIVCTRSGKLHPLKSKNPDLVLFKFGEVMMKKMPTICGKPVEIFVREDGTVFPLAELNPDEGKSETKKKSGKSSGKGKSTPATSQDEVYEVDEVEDVPEEIVVEEVVDLDDTSGIPFSLVNDSQEIIQPEEVANFSIITPSKPSAFVSTTSTPLPSTSILRNVSSFVPGLSPILNDPPIIVQSVPLPKPVLKPLEVNALKRPIPISLEALKPGDLVLINEEPAPKRLAPVSIENLNSRNLILINQMPLIRNQNQGSEIETLARSKSLHSLTIPVLKTFCQQNGIQVSYRDKKDAIVQKVYEFFGV